MIYQKTTQLALFFCFHHINQKRIKTRYLDEKQEKCVSKYERSEHQATDIAKLW